MFAQFSQRLSPHLARSTKTMATTTKSPMTTMNLASRVGVSSMARSASSVSAPPSFLGRAMWTGIPKSNMFPGSLSSSLPPSSLTSNATLVSPSAANCSPNLVGGIFASQTRGFASKKHKWVIRQSKGFRGRANRCFRVAIRRLEKSWQYAYRDRKVKKREFRKLWIQRLNAGVRQHGVSYSKFIQMQTKSGVVLDRKILSGLAMHEPFSFKAVVDVIQKTSAENGARLEAGN